MTPNSEFIFKPLVQSDLNLLCQWFRKPHVVEWWEDNLSPEDIKDKYGRRIGNSIICPYIAYLNDKPVGFIQYYWAAKVGDGWWPHENENTVGLDQFIGEENFINKGYGTAMIKQFIEFLLILHPSIKKILTEASPNNLRARRCYEKVGFEEVGFVDTPEGKSLLLVLHK